MVKNWLGGVCAGTFVPMEFPYKKWMIIPWNDLPPLQCWKTPCGRAVQVGRRHTVDPETVQTNGVCPPWTLNISKDHLRKNKSLTWKWNLICLKKARHLGGPETIESLKSLKASLTELKIMVVLSCRLRCHRVHQKTLPGEETYSLRHRDRYHLWSRVFVVGCVGSVAF